MIDNVLNNKRIAKNTAFLYIRMAFVLIISLYTSRVVLNTLGVEEYGVYNVVAGFVSMFGFLNATLSSSMQRFYNYEGSIDKVNGYRKVFTTGVVIHIFLALALCAILESFGLWYVNHVMVVPETSLFSANIVFQTSVLSMILVILQIPFTGAIMADERMNFYAIISVIDVVLKLIAIIFLPYLPFNKLITYGVLLLFITIFDTLAYYTYAKRTVLDFELVLKVDRLLFKSLLSFSGWNLLGTFAFLLKGQGLNMLLNSFFGTVINAARGIAYQVNGAINGFSANLATAFRPQLVNSYAQKNYARTRRLFFWESKVCFALMAVLMIPVAVEIDYLLCLWLGDIVPEYTNIFAVLVLFDSLICTLNTPCTQVAYAVGNLKKYQIITAIVNLCLLPICWIGLAYGLNSIYVFVMTIVFSILNQIICLLLLRKLFPYGLTTYIKEVILPCLIFMGVVPLAPIILHKICTCGFVRLIVVFATDILVGIIATYSIIFNREEKKIIKNIVITKIFHQ